MNGRPIFAFVVLCAAYEVGKNALDIRSRDVYPDQVIIPVNILIPAVADAFEQRAGIVGGGVASSTL